MFYYFSFKERKVFEGKIHTHTDIYTYTPTYMYILWHKLYDKMYYCFLSYNFYHNSNLTTPLFSLLSSHLSMSFCSNFISYLFIMKLTNICLMSPSSFRVFFNPLFFKNVNFVCCCYILLSFKILTNVLFHKLYYKCYHLFYTFIFFHFHFLVVLKTIEFFFQEI